MLLGVRPPVICFNNCLVLLLLQWSHTHTHTHTHTQHACGYEYTSRLQRMVVDMKLSAEGNAKFSDHLQAEGSPLAISFSALVLQSAAWPLTSSPCPLVLPRELVPVLQKVRWLILQNRAVRIMLLEYTITRQPIFYLQNWPPLPIH